ncbi:hypothetical protein AVEN_147406-1 [Araneus ventricosus]|uniref:Uncharacterized protein n=1 Tax=Araneus ventricosus TaxID=182803 RepID=A0A4Y2DPY3_ARAVE|nr:hypothetical protein AVEN_147406-1 [Araneus ventricosus]
MNSPHQNIPKPAYCLRTFQPNKKVSIGEPLTQKPVHPQDVLQNEIRLYMRLSSTLQLSNEHDNMPTACIYIVSCSEPSHGSTSMYDKMQMKLQLSSTVSGTLAANTCPSADCFTCLKASLINSNY